MKILFTAGTSSLSKWIRSATREPVSHCALQFGHFVVHSNLAGIHLEWSANFRRANAVVLQLTRVEAKDEDDLTNLGKLLETVEFSFYDVGALFFIALSLLLRKLGLPLPKSNLWQSAGMYLCTEWVGRFIDSADYSMITPLQLYEKLKGSGNWRDANGEEEAQV